MLKEYLAAIKQKRVQKFIETAVDEGIKVEVLSSDFKILKFTDEKNEKLLYGEQFFLNRKPGTLFTKNKEITKILLADAGLSVPEGIVAKNFEEAKKLMGNNSIDYPVVIKPIDAAKGLGVTVDVKDDEELQTSIKKIEECLKETTMSCSGEFLVETMKMGDDYRVLYLNGESIACAQRVPASVTGDGKNTIKFLIESFNKTRSSSYAIVIDEELMTILKDKGFTLDSVLKEDEYIRLRENANISSGGKALDKTKTMSERFKKIAICAAEKLDLDYAGVDIMTADISSDDPNQEYNIIEINGAPDFDIHEKPVIDSEGIDVTRLLVRAFMK